MADWNWHHPIYWIGASLLAALAYVNIYGWRWPWSRHRGGRL
jgi:hypothetical protein